MCAPEYPRLMGHFLWNLVHMLYTFCSCDNEKGAYWNHLLLCYQDLFWQLEITGSIVTIAVASTEADEAIAASSDFLKIIGISPQNEPTGVIQVIFDHFASSDFNVWLRWWWLCPHCVASVSSV